MQARSSGAALLFLLTCVLAGLLFQGCASVRELSDKSDLPPNSIPVIGAVRLLNAPEYGSRILTIALDDSEKTVVGTHKLNSPEYFVWHLPFGKYRVLYFKYSTPTFWPYEGWLNKRLWLSFEVPPDATSVYVGTLSIDVESPLGRGTSVLDDLPTAIEKLQGKIMLDKNKIFKSILVEEAIR